MDEQRDFEITASADEKLLDLLMGHLQIKGLLNENLKLKDYAPETPSLFVIYQVFAPDDEYCQYQEKRRVKRKTKEVELYLNLDYHKFNKADGKEAITMMAERYLRGIKKHLAIKGFDHEKFHSDVEKLFVDNGLLGKKEERLERAKREISQKLEKIHDLSAVNKIMELMDNELSEAV